MKIKNCCPLPLISSNLDSKEVHISKMDVNSILSSISIFILAYLLSRLGTKNDLLLPALLGVIIGFFIAFFGWEYEWTTGCGLDNNCKNNYTERQKVDGKLTTPNWLHAIFTALFDGLFIGASFLLAWRLFPNSHYIPNWKFLGFVIFF